MQIHTTASYKNRITPYHYNTSSKDSRWTTSKFKNAYLRLLLQSYGYSLKNIDKALKKAEKNNKLGEAQTQKKNTTG